MAVPLDPQRAFDVTASDVAAICGENPWQKRRHVLFSKTFKIPFEGNEATEWGKRYEPVAIAKFCKATGAVVANPFYKKHDIYTWFGGTVDGIATMPDGTVGVLEVKCPLKRSFKEGDDVPSHYVAQVQSYMEIFDLPLCFFVQFKPAGVRSEERMTIIRVKRDVEYMRLRLPRLLDFWKEMTVWTAQTSRIIVVIQRAWRAYLARRAVDSAAKRCLVARLHCARVIGKIAGFIKKKDVNNFRIREGDAAGRSSIGVEAASHPVVPFSFKSFAPPKGKQTIYVAI